MTTRQINYTHVIAGGRIIKGLQPDVSPHNPLTIARCKDLIKIAHDMTGIFYNRIVILDTYFDELVGSIPQHRLTKLYRYNRAINRLLISQRQGNQDTMILTYANYNGVVCRDSAVLADTCM